MARFNPGQLQHQPPSERDFIAALAQFQESASINDTAFANMLGVHDSTWRQTKRGFLPLGWKVLLGGVRFAPYELFLVAQASLMARAQRSRASRKDSAGRCTGCSKQSAGTPLRLSHN